MGGLCKELGMRLGDWTWRNIERGEDLQLTYLLSWPVWPMGHQGILVGVGCWDKAMGGDGVEERWAAAAGGLLQS